MNGRVFAVNRSPVLAWNVEPPLQVPYPDMPAAAAAAISPIVPAASDPYSRCWQNQVDAGTSFPYFGALYNNSLPPTAYRLQPGCMANLGQFWPPTPPPDGCGRFDGSNTLYFGPPVLRHGENISSNLRNSFQGLGHYSHLVETPKEPNQRSFKRETPISPTVSASNMSMGSSVTKSDNLNTYCVVDNKLKPQTSIPNSLPKQENNFSVPSSGHESYICAPDSRSSSSMHPSTDKTCFSPSYSLKNPLSFHSSSQDNAHKAKSLNGTQENNCNASPLKNVYFSHFESENINVHSKNFDKTNDGHFHFEQKNSSLDVNKSKHSHQSSNNYVLHNNFSSKKYDFQGSQEFCNISPSCHIARGERQGDNVVLIAEQYRQKNNVCKVKPERNNHADCKFQKSGSKSSTVVQIPVCRNSDDVFNIPTSVMHPKIEPNDKYFLSSCSSTAQSCMANSYTNSGPFLLAKDLTSDLRTGASYRNMVYPNSCSLSKSWQYNEMPLISPDNYFKAPEAAKPPVQGSPHANSTFHEGLISVAQTAPQDIDILKANGKLQQNERLSNSKKVCSPTIEADDEVQIIGVQTKQSSQSKSSSRHLESKVNCFQPVSVAEPLCLKSEKEKETPFEFSESTSYVGKSVKEIQWLKSEPVPDGEESNAAKISEKERKNADKINDTGDCNKEFCTKENKVPESNYDSVIIKKEICENESETDLKHANEESVKNSENEKAIKKTIENEISKIVNSSKSDIQGTCEVINEKEAVPEKASSISYFNENHGLNLLLNTIEKVTSLEKSNISLHSCPVKYESSVDSTDTDMIDTYPEVSKTSGLDLLSVIAGQRLVTEFDSIKSEPDDTSEIKSNYPDIKQENKEMHDEDEQLKNFNNISANSQKSSVFEMQDRLVELQKKYKQKQKELSRLKPKKRLANTYLKGRQKFPREDSEMSFGASRESVVCNMKGSSISTVTNKEMPNVETAFKNSNNLKSLKNDNTDGADDNKVAKKKLSPKKNNVAENASGVIEKRITRSLAKPSLKQVKSKLDDENLDHHEHPKKVTRNSSNKVYKLRNSKESATNSTFDDEIQVICSKSDLPNKESTKKSILPESEKNIKVYALRNTSQNISKKCGNVTDVEANSALSSKTISNKRKPDNPKKFMPSKQSKLSETIIAKHLRSRILFDTSGAASDDDNLKDGGVPDDLYDALMKCHLGEESKKLDILSKSIEDVTIPATSALGSPEPSKLKAEHLVENQRLLALEDGLFYAGYIKEIQVSDRYGIALDGQRGNRLHIFSRDELLNQAIIESKPLSPEIPEGTRVCAYWSQQYRCLYPGVVGKAPCPSADWSEPRVFVLFDDGDSGQIPTKNIRLIPPDIVPSETEHKLNPQETSIKYSKINLKVSPRGQTSRRLRCSSKTKHCDMGNDNESKESSCASVNESSCDDSCFVDYSLSPSQNSESPNSIENSASSLSTNPEAAKLEKRQRKRSKRKADCYLKYKELDSIEIKEKSEAKTKRHKKYKEKHRRHHHHHHHHRRHHHHRHHSKKRKHRRKSVKNLTSQDVNENCIPCSINHKAFKNFQLDAETCTDHVEHSSTVNLPQNEQDRVC